MQDDDYDMNKPEKFTDEDKIEFEQLKNDGFNSWKKSDFQSFINACIKFGRKDDYHNHHLAFLIKANFAFYHASILFFRCQIIESKVNMLI
jgi:hypothetical protein